MTQTQRAGWLPRSHFARSLLVTLLILTLTAAGYRWQRQRVAAQARLEEWQADARLDEHLEQIVELKFKSTVAPQAWLDEWSRQTGVRAHILNLKEDPWDKAPEMPSLPPMTAGDALQTFSKLQDSSWSTTADREVVVDYDLYNLPKIVRTYRVPVGLSRAEEEDLLIAARDNLGLWYQSKFAQFDKIIPVPGSVTIFETHEVQRLAAKLFAGFAFAIERGQQIPAQGLAPDDPQLAPIHLSNDNAAARRLQDKLEELVAFDIRAMPLHEFTGMVSQRLGVPVVIDSAVIDDGVTPDHPVRCQIPNVSFRSALRIALGDLNLTYHLEANGRYVLISTADHGFHLNGQSMVAYPVPDLVALSGGGQDYEPLMDVIRSHVEMDSWSGVGGPGKIFAGGNGRVLFVEQRSDVHAQIPLLLTAIRQVLSGQVAAANMLEPSPHRRRIKGLLEQSVKFDYVNVPLQDVIADLQTRTKLPLRLTKKIEDVGIEPEMPVWCYLPARPLGANLRYLLAHYNLDLMVRDDHAAVTCIEDAQDMRNLATEVFDLRPYLLRGRHLGPEICDLLRATVEPDSWQDVGGPASLTEFRGLLIVYQHADRLDHVRLVLRILEEQVLKGAPAPATADLLAETAQTSGPHWSEPLGFSTAKFADRLQTRETVDYQQTPMGEALHALAAKHDLPVIYPAGFVPLGLDAPLTFQATDRPVVEIIRKLIGEDYFAHGEHHQLASESLPRVRMYAVGDLLKPHGKFSPEELTLILENPLNFDDAAVSSGAHYEIHLQQFLVAYLSHQEVVPFERKLQQLRQSPTGEQP